MKSEAMNGFSTLFHRLDVGQAGAIFWPEFVVATKKPEIEL